MPILKKLNPLEITPEMLEFAKTKEGRVELSKHSFLVFMGTYYQHKVTIEPAVFHEPLINTLQYINDFIAVLGFRGSAKSTILEAYALWCMLTGRSKYTIYIGQTDEKARQNVMNIKNELETNVLIQQDFNISIETKNKSISDKWSEGQITIKGNTIVAKSRGAKGIRGSLFNGKRLELIICDDIEDTENTKTQESRLKTRKWFFTEVVPATSQGSLSTEVKIILLGNLVHRDCLISNLDKMKLDNENIVNVIRLPLLDDDGDITWKALYPNMEAVNKQKQKVMLAGQGLGSVIWAREYLLKEVDEEDQIIKDTDIQYYDDNWLQRKWLRTGVGVDLAISKSSTADYTTMVRGVMVQNDYGEQRLLILKNPIKKRLDFVETIQEAKNINIEMMVRPVFYVEDVAYQKSAIQVMERNGLSVVPVKVTSDKRSRLIAVSPYIKSGMVLFPKDGASAILEEVIGFGIEPHDDVLDALVHLIGNMLNSNKVIIG